MRVGFVLPAESGGGAERIVLEVARRLAARGHAVHALIAGRGTGTAALVAPGVTAVPLGSGSTRGSIRPLLAAIRAHRIPVVCSTLKHISVMVEAARALGRTPFAHAIRLANTYGEELAPLPAPRRILMRTALAWAHRRADASICVSAGVAEDLARLCPAAAGRSVTVANPVFDPDMVAKAAMPSGDPRLDGGCRRDVVAVGRLAPQKGFDVLLPAMARLHADSHLHILGDGPERGRLLEQAAGLGIAGRVHLHGFVANPHAFLARAGVFALSSRFEGLPNVLIQALCLGTRVVATDCRSGPREILDGRADGRLVPVGDPTALAAALEQALDAGLPAVDPLPYRMLYDAEARSLDYERILGGLAS